MIRGLQRAAALLRRELDADVILLLVALSLIVVGCWSWWRPGAFLIPGGVLLWIVLPSRRPFITERGTTEARTAQIPSITCNSRTSRRSRPAA